jgi:membrane-associated phospholipid phosphatase
VLLAGTCAAIAVVTGLMARTHDVAGAERSIGRWAYDLPDWTTDAFEAVMQAGNRAVVLVVAIGLVLLDRRRAGLVLLASGLLTWTLAGPLKDAVGRDRPTPLLLGRPLRDEVERNGWPSTHAALSAALATALILSLPMRRWQQLALVGLAVGTAMARVHLAVHWTLDVVGGAAIGVGVACLVHLFARRFE